LAARREGSPGRPVSSAQLVAVSVRTSSDRSMTAGLDGAGSRRPRTAARRAGSETTVWSARPRSSRSLARIDAGAGSGGACFAGAAACPLGLYSSSNTGTDAVAESSLISANSVSVALKGTSAVTPRQAVARSPPWSSVDLPDPGEAPDDQDGEVAQPPRRMRGLSGAAKNQPRIGSITSGAFSSSRSSGKSWAAATEPRRAGLLGCR
jgi:hypothetical protein